MPRTVRRHLSALVAVVVAGAIAAAATAHAQVLYGSIVGTVTDSTGATLPGATVSIEQMETTLTRELVSDPGGNYHFTAVPAGTYTIVVKMNGFRTSSRSNVPVTINSTARVDAKLELGQLAETVMVSGDSPILQTDRAKSGRS